MSASLSCGVCPTSCLHNQLVNWLSGIYSPLIISGCQYLYLILYNNQINARALIGTEADKGQSQNIYKIRKNISNRNVFLEITVEEFIKSEKLLQILIKLLNPQILFCESKNCR